jgi:hypothetical protein
MSTRQQREKLIHYCRSGIVEEALKIVWNDPAIVRDSGCEMLWKGRNKTILAVLRRVSELVCRMDGVALVGMETGRPGWLVAIVRLPEVSCDALKVVLFLCVNNKSGMDLALCAAIVAGLGRFKAQIRTDKMVVDALIGLLEAANGLDDDSCGIIRSIMRPDGN